MTIAQAMVLVLPNRWDAFGAITEPITAPKAGAANTKPKSATGVAKVSVRKSTMVELEAEKKKPIEEVSKTNLRIVFSE